VTGATVRTQHPLIVRFEPSKNINADSIVLRSLAAAACRSDSVKPFTQRDLTAIDSALTIARQKHAREGRP
jgi:hypothetical protein